MSREIDERVVSMSFDNKKFEANVKESMSTIDKLKQALKFDNVKDSFGEVEKGFQKFDVSPVTKGVDKIKISFSALQVAGATVVSELTKDFMGLGQKISGVWTTMTNQIKNGGMSRSLNVEQATHMIEALGYKYKDVEDSISRAVNGAAYGADEAAAAASQLLASSVKTGEEMDHALRGITGVASMTGAAYGDIADIFTDAAATGKVSGMELERMATRGLNAAATLGKAMNKTEAEIRDMVRKGQIDFKTFAKVMDDTFGESAVDANSTYSGSLANMKSAFSRFGQVFSDNYIDKVKDVFNAIRESVNGIKEAVVNSGLADVINGFVSNVLKIGEKLIKAIPIDKLEKPLKGLSERLKGFLDLGMDSKWSTLNKKMKGLGVSTKQFQKALRAAAKENGINVKKMEKEDGSFVATLKRGWLTADIFTKAIDKLTGKGKKALKPMKDANKALAETRKLVNTVIRGDWGNGQERIDRMKKAGIDYASTQKLVNKTMWEGKITVDDLTDAQLKNAGYSKKQIKQLRELAKEAKKTGTPIEKLFEQMERPTGAELMVDSFKNIFGTIKDLIKTVGTAYNEMFPKKSTLTLYNIIDKFNKFTKKLKLNKTQLDQIKRAFKGVFAVADLVKEVIKGLVNGFETLIKLVSGDGNSTIEEFIAKIGDLLVKLHDWIMDNDVISNVIGIVVNVIAELIKKVKKLFDLISQNGFVQGIIESLKWFFENVATKGWPFLKDLLAVGKSKIGDVFSKIKEFLDNNPHVQKFVDKFKEFTDSLAQCETTSDKVKTALTGIIDVLKTLATEAFNAVKEGFEKIAKFLDPYIKKIKEKFENIDWGVVISLLIGVYARCI